MGLGIPALESKMLLESSPLKSSVLVGRLGAAIIVHYEYMALAKKTSVLREAMLLLIEPR